MIKAAKAAAADSKRQHNYVAIYGTSPGDYVDGNSHLCEGIYQTLLFQSRNPACEAVLPFCFEYFHGHDGKA